MTHGTILLLQGKESELRDVRSVRKPKVQNKTKSTITNCVFPCACKTDFFNKSNFFFLFRSCSTLHHHKPEETNEQHAFEANSHYDCPAPPNPHLTNYKSLSRCRRWIVGCTRILHLYRTGFTFVPLISDKSALALLWVIIFFTRVLTELAHIPLMPIIWVFLMIT